MALPAVDDGDGTISVADFLEQLRADPTGSGSSDKNPNGDRKNGGSKPMKTISSSLPLSPRPPGSPPQAGAFKITTEITTTYVKDLHELIQRITPGNGPNCLQATFDVQNRHDQEGNTLPSFQAKLKISGVKGLEGEWVDEGPFANKKLAKEAVARRGGEWLKDVVKGWGRQGGKMGGGGKGGVLAPAPIGSAGVGDEKIVDVMEEEVLVNGEWVGRLNTYVQKRRFKPPAYTHYATLTSSAFSCTVVIPELTGHSVSTPLPNLNPTEFGCPKTFYRKKSSARAAAARDAVLWIWSVDPAAKNAALLSPSTRHLALPGSSLTASPDSGVVEITIPPELKDARAPQLVAWLCPKLSLCALEYVFASPNNVPNLVDAWGRVKRVKPSVDVDQIVELGPVQNVFGKPAARGKIAELCLYWMCRRESARLGVKIIGLKPEFYGEEDDADDAMSVLSGVIEGGTKGSSQNSESGGRIGSVVWARGSGGGGGGGGGGSSHGSSRGAASVAGGEGEVEMRIEQEEVVEEEEDDTMSLA